MSGRLQTCSALERVWILALLGRGNEAVHEGQALLAGSTNRLHPCLSLPTSSKSRYRCRKSARRHEEALREKFQAQKVAQQHDHDH
jgi:hypothetical protein